jgi:hypothetical protein
MAWKELVVVKSGLDTSRAPVVLRISKNSETRELSYEFGILVSGKMKPLRYWREDRLFSVAMLIRAATSLSLSQLLTGASMTQEKLEQIIRATGVLEIVEGWVGSKQEKQSKKRFGTNLGSLMPKKPSHLAGKS